MALQHNKCALFLSNRDAFVRLSDTLAFAVKFSMPDWVTCFWAHRVKGLALLSLGTTLAGLEGRVVFRALEQFLALHPPWSYILVTSALYGTAALVVMHLTGNPLCPACLSLSTSFAWASSFFCL
eukprot:scaffold135563_cov31-Prasinocladus_malaysianus.AAC.1